MPAPVDTTPQPSAKPVSRWRIGSLSVLQVVLMILLLVGVNFLSSRYYLRKDITRDGTFTLSPATTRYLQSPAVQGRKDPIRWIVAVRASYVFSDRIRAMAEEYSRLSNGKIQLTLIDPVRNLDRAQQIAATYGMYDPGNERISKKDLIIVDARSQEEIEAATREKKPASNHVRIVDSDGMVTFEIDSRTKQRKPAGFQGEDSLTAALVGALEGVPRKVYFLADKSRIDTENSNSAWNTLRTTLALQNILLEPIPMAGLTEIPLDAAGIALVAPKYDFTDEEILILERYWERSKSAILCLLKPDEVPAKLRAFLRQNGVTPQRDHIVTVRNGQTIPTVRANFTEGVEFLRDLARQATIFEGTSASLEVKEDASDPGLSNRRIQPVPLIQAAPDYWGEVKFGQGAEAFDPREDRAGPLYLAAAVTRGSETDERFAAESSRMLVVSNTDFLDPNRLVEANLDFLASSTNWLVGREELAGIGPHSLGIYKIPLLDAQVSFINKINWFFLPAAALLIAGFVWSSRRA